MGDEFLINMYTTGQQGFWLGGKEVSGSLDGDYVVTWNSCCRQDGSSDAVVGQRLARNGQRQGDEFIVNTYTTSGQCPLTVVSDWQGNFLVTWRSNDFRNGFNNLWGQLFDHHGQRAARIPSEHPG